MTTEIHSPARTRFRGIVLDMDGVLCDSERLICEAAMGTFAEKYHPAVRPEDFLPLANVLLVLYPKESEERRLLDAMLLAVPR